MPLADHGAGGTEIAAGVSADDELCDVDGGMLFQAALPAESTIRLIFIFDLDPCGFFRDWPNLRDHRIPW